METRSIAPQSAPVKWGRITPQGGFTLIEILMAMTIFSTSFLALAAGATTVMKSNHSSYNSTIATNLKLISPGPDHWAPPYVRSRRWVNTGLARTTEVAYEEI